MSESKRTYRVAGLLQQELAKMLIDDIRDPRVGFATVTEVRVTPNLRSARVYVSVFGTDKERSESLEGLEAAAGYMKRELGRRLALKYTPELTFFRDDSLDRVDRLDQLMTAISDGETETPAHETGELPPAQTARSELLESAKSLDSIAPEPRKTSGKRKRGRRRQGS